MRPVHRVTVAVWPVATSGNVAAPTEASPTESGRDRSLRHTGDGTTRSAAGREVVVGPEGAVAVADSLLPGQAVVVPRRES